jgi:DNA-binding PadR family transcriptional regulator
MFEDMASNDLLGGLELLVLLALIRLRDEAYGVPIAAAIAAHSGRDVALGSVYVALDRLARKGLVKARRGEPTAVRGGRAKTYFRVTARGLRQAQRARAALMGLWDGLPQLTEA